MTPYDLTARNSTEALPTILRDLLDTGDRLNSRNGTVYELSPARITLTEPALHPEMTTPGRRASLPAQIAETMWILAGRDDISWLSHYLPRAPQFSDDGQTWRGAYGPRIRYWDGHTDQLRYVAELLDSDPDSRRAVINIYNPTVDSTPGLDVPCNDWLHFLIRDGSLNLHVATRSNDVIWGWSGINSFEWTALLMVLAGALGVEPGSITFSISSLHLYEHHKEKAERILDNKNQEDLVPAHTSFEFPPQNHLDPIERLDIAVSIWMDIEEIIRTAETELEISDAIDFIRGIEFPVLRSWAYVMFSHWHGGSLGYFYQDTTLNRAMKDSPQRKRVAAASDRAGAKPATWFNRYLVDLHTEKSRAYGDSWKKRGEQYSILPNVARKVDRLAAGTDTSDESAADTAVDLYIYLMKYWNWIQDQTMGLEHGDDTETVNGILAVYEPDAADHTGEPGATLAYIFDHQLIPAVERGAERLPLLLDMITLAYNLARVLWSRAEWKAGNATRTWKGYDPDDVYAISGD